MTFEFLILICKSYTMLTYCYMFIVLFVYVLIYSEYIINIIIYYTGNSEINIKCNFYNFIISNSFFLVNTKYFSRMALYWNNDLERPKEYWNTYFCIIFKCLTISVCAWPNTNFLFWNGHPCFWHRISIG